MALLAMLAAWLPMSAAAEAFTCTHRWPEQAQTTNHPSFVEINGDEVVWKGNAEDLHYRILENSPDELIAIRTNTKAKSGKDYPVGASLIVLDKASMKLVMANIHTEDSFWPRGTGRCALMSK